MGLLKVHIFSSISYSKGLKKATKIPYNFASKPPISTNKAERRKKDMASKSSKLLITKSTVELKIQQLE